MQLDVCQVKVYGLKNVTYLVVLSDLLHVGNEGKINRRYSTGSVSAAYKSALSIQLLTSTTEMPERYVETYTSRHYKRYFNSSCLYGIVFHVLTL